MLELDNKERIAVIYANIGMVSLSTKNCEKSIEYYEKLLNLASSNKGDSNSLIHANINSAYDSLARCYEHLGNFDKSLFYFRKVLDQSENNSQDQSKKYGLSQSAFYTSRIGRVLLKKGKTEEALTHFQKALSMNQKLGQQEEIAMSYVNIGDVYMKTGEKIKAEEAFKKGHEILKKLNNPPHLKEVEDRLNMFSKQF